MLLDSRFVMRRASFWVNGLAAICLACTGLFLAPATAAAQGSRTMFTAVLPAQQQAEKTWWQKVTSFVNKNAASREAMVQIGLVVCIIATYIIFRSKPRG